MRRDLAIADPKSTNEAASANRGTAPLLQPAPRAGRVRRCRIPSIRRGASPASPRAPVTPAVLDRMALAYLERYASSAGNLQRVLARKVERRCRLREEDPGPFLPLVEEAVARAVVVRARERCGAMRRREWRRCAGAGARHERSRRSSRRRGWTARRRRTRSRATTRPAPPTIPTPIRSWRPPVRSRSAGESGRFRVGARAENRDRDLARLARAGFSLRRRPRRRRRGPGT